MNEQFTTSHLARREVFQFGDHRSLPETAERIATALETLVGLLEGRITESPGGPVESHEPEQREVDSPYFTGEEAAAYLRITMNALYGLVERRKLRPLPGSRKYRFTKEQLDAFLRGK